MSTLKMTLPVRALVASVVCLFGAVQQARSIDASGSAFSISDGLTFASNYHVVEGAETICYRTSDGELGKAVIYDSRPSDDLVLLRGNTYVEPLSLGRNSDVEKGGQISAFGYPLIDRMGLELKVTSGYVNALSGIQGDSRFLQISAPLQPGNSGGPLINEFGQVVGVVTEKLRATKEITPEDVGYAVKVSQLNALIDSDRKLSKIAPPMTSRRVMSLSSIVRETEDSVVLILTLSRESGCADDFDVDIPAVGKEPVSREIKRRMLMQAEMEAAKLAEARLAEEAAIRAEEAKLAAVIQREKELEAERLRKAQELEAARLKEEQALEAERLEKEQKLEAERQEKERIKLEREREAKRKERDRELEEKRLALEAYHQEQELLKQLAAESERNRQESIEAALKTRLPNWRALQTTPQFALFLMEMLKQPKLKFMSLESKDEALAVAEQYLTYAAQRRRAANAVGMSVDMFPMERLRVTESYPRLKYFVTEPARKISQVKFCLVWSTNLDLWIKTAVAKQNERGVSFVSSLSSTASSVSVGDIVWGYY